MTSLRPEASLASELKGFLVEAAAASAASLASAAALASAASLASASACTLANASAVTGWARDAAAAVRSGGNGIGNRMVSERVFLKD